MNLPDRLLESSLIGVVGVKLLLLVCVDSAGRFQSSVTPVASGWINLGKAGQVEIDDGVQRLGCRAFLQGVGQRREPVGILSLQC